jgi:amino acid permease
MTPTIPPPPPFHWQQHVVVTLFLTGTSLALALIIPDIKVLFGLLGGTASSIIGFCIPGLLGLQLSKDLLLLNDHHGDDDDNTGATAAETARRTRVVSWCLLVGGALVGAVTTVATIYEIALTHRRP